MSVPAAYEVNAFNTAASSDNKIHDDTVARRFGFRGGLVPGVEVYAYMAHMPVARWGRAWLEGGGMECRFLKPVYDGAVARVTAEENDELSCSRSRAFKNAARRGALSGRRISDLRLTSMRSQTAGPPQRDRRQVRLRWRPDVPLESPL
jgi:acyl dehydratase